MATRRTGPRPLHDVCLHQTDWPVIMPQFEIQG